MNSEINELTNKCNKYAQLQEDHVSDILSIKAKETQLVRARSDAEAAEQNVQAQQREIERLKRELSRQVRASSPGPLDLLGDQGQYGSGTTITESDGAHRRQNSRAFGGSPSVKSAGSAASGGASNMEGKENFAPREHPVSFPASEVCADRKSGVGSVGLGMGNTFGMSSGMSSPRNSRMTMRSPDIDAPPGPGRTGSSGSFQGNSGGGAESWKRAAEVTQNLKARIEMMKVSLFCPAHCSQII
jgi:cytoskeleton-associated protein 5